MTDLLKLAERVEAGELGSQLCWRIAEALGTYSDIGRERVEYALDGSLDAAKTLHDAVLPEELKPRICQTTVGWTVYMIVGHNGIVAAGKANHPAAAWIAATLRAKANDK